MTILCVILTYMLCVAAAAPHLRTLQTAHYRAWGAMPKGQALCLAGLALYAVIACFVWPWCLPDARWRALYLTVAYLPTAAWLVASVRSAHPARTHRLWRLWAVYALMMAVPAVLAACLPSAYYVWGMGGAAVYPVVQVAAMVTYPIETMRNRRFIRRMRDKLRAMRVCTVGITGSAGKTTVKRLVTAALGEGCYATPGNYNTPIGLALSIRAMPADTRWFVAEMGVGRPNDMVDLLDVVHPDVGVVTCVLPQHTAHFASVQQIRQEKCRLLQCASWPLCHVSVGYASHTFGEGGEWWAEQVRLARDATTFDICSRAERHTVTLPLVGRQTVDNALAAWAVARHLGVVPEVIAARWRYVRPEPHRLSVSRTPQGVYVVDDGYNCNIRGAEYALEYLRLYEGRKVVTTSGIEEADPALCLNRRLGEMIAGTADVVVVVGRRHLAELMAGLGTRIEVHTVPDTAHSVALYRQLLHEGDVVLIMADYPS